MTRAIIVMTIGRSGSSALAGALHQAGIPFYDGKKDHIGKNRDLNAKGHFEMHSWFRPDLRLSTRVAENGHGYPSDLSPLVDELRKVIERRNEANPVIWGVKSTTLPWTLPHLLPYFPADHRVIVSARRRLPLAQSLKRHNGTISQQQAEEMVDKRLHQMWTTVEGLTCPVLTVRFEELVRYTRRTMRRALDFCYDGIELVQPDKLCRASEWIDPSLVHYGHGRR